MCLTCSLTSPINLGLLNGYFLEYVSRSEGILTAGISRFQRPAWQWKKARELREKKIGIGLFAW
jgi:hypothetical protein